MPVPVLLDQEDPQLREICEIVTTAEAQPIIKKLRDIIAHVPWGSAAGMAAPQIGINRRVFIARHKVYINPWVKNLSGGSYVAQEGCFSLEANKNYPVKRYRKVELMWYDEKGEEHHETIEGYDAQVIQHEYDHIECRLLTDYER